MKKYRKIISYSFVLLVSIVIARQIYSEKEVINSIKWNISLTGVVLFLGTFVLSYIGGLLSWQLLTRYLKIVISFADNSQIWVTSNLTRYLPGGIWQYPSRVILLTKKGQTKSRSSTAVVLEMIFLLGIGAFVAATTLPYWQGDTIFNLLIPMVSFLAIIPLVIWYFLSREEMIFGIIGLLNKVGVGGNISRNDMKVDSSKILPFLAVSIIRFYLVGLSFYFLLNLMYPINITAIIPIIGIFTFSWLVGYVAFISPSGIGVRDGVLAILLSSYMPTLQIVSASIAFRVALIVLEVLVFAILTTYRKYGHNLTWL